MKRIAIGILCAGMLGPIHAEDKNQNQGDWRETCKQFSENASLVMKARQMGIAMSKLMNKMDDQVHQEMVIEAYDNPRYSTDEMQQNAINDFRDKWYLHCAKSMRQQ